MSNTIKLLVGLILLLGVVLGIAFLGFGLLQYQQFQASAGELPLASTMTQVSIINLSNGDAAQLGVPLVVEGFAAGPHAILSIELWINGQPVSLQAAAAMGSSPFATSFTWLPEIPGAHSLLLRASDENGQTTNSKPVIVMVPEDASGDGNDVAAVGSTSDAPVVFPSGGGGGGYSGQAPAGDDSVGDGQDWDGSPGDWLNNASDAPQAPELSAAAGQCSVALSIHDLSDNESGFRVERYAPSFDQWTVVTTLDGQSEYDWLMYSDIGVAGGVQYQVVAFNQAGHAASNVVPVNVDPGDCPEVQAELGVVNFTLQSLNGTLPTDRAYCYRSFDGGADWERWPTSDYFYPDADGALNVLLHRAWLFDTAGEPAAEPLGLMLECWGWAGETLVPLGGYESAGIDPMQGGLFPIGSGQSELVLGIAPENMLESTEFYPLNDWTGHYQYVGDTPLELGHVLAEFAPEEREMPGIQLYLTYDAAFCEAHLPAEHQNLFGRILFCFPYPGFDAEGGGGGDGINPQPYLVWSFNINGCRAAIYDASECKTYEYFLDQAEANGGQIGFWIYDSASSNPHAQNAPGFTQFVIPPMECLVNGHSVANRTFSVQMWYKPGKEGPPELVFSPSDGLGELSEMTLTNDMASGLTLTRLSFIGPLSNQVSLPCPEPIGDNVPVEIIFQTLQLGATKSIDDGDDVDDVEVYGYFWAELNSPLSGGDRYLNIATWQDHHDDCPLENQDIFVLVGELASKGCPHHFYNDTVSFASLYACDSSYKDKCSIQIGPNHHMFTSFEDGNDNIVVDVGDGDALHLHVEFWDYDELSADDLLCVGHVTLEARNIFEWSQVNESGAFISPPQESGSCSITFHVQAVP